MKDLKKGNQLRRSKKTMRKMIIGIVSITIMLFLFQKVISPYQNKYGLHPLLNKKITLMIKEANQKGVDLRIIEGHRSIVEQAYLYSKGRIIPGNIVTYALPGISFHNYGLAVDVCEFKNGKPIWNSENWDLIGSIGKKQDLIWGGNWKRIVDKPHFQLRIKDLY